jgi:hypothetical protein
MARNILFYVFVDSNECFQKSGTKNMSIKYRKLTTFLAHLEEPEWRASFAEIEDIIGFPLPESARLYQAWWANQFRAQSLGWQSAGFKAVDLDLKDEKVTFVYVDGAPTEKGGKSADGGEVRPLSIAEAKAGLAATFGIDPAQIEIVIKG